MGNHPHEFDSEHRRGRACVLLLEHTQSRACFIQSWGRGGAGLGADNQISPSSREARYQHCSQRSTQDPPGIGDACSQKIIDGSPYRTQLDLLRKNIIPRATFDKI